MLKPFDQPNWNMFHPSTETPSLSIGENGPDESESLDVRATNTFVLRSQPVTYFKKYSNISSVVSKGDFEIFVSDPSIFSVGEKIDLVDGESLSFAHNITEVLDSSIKIETASVSNVSDMAQGNGMVQLSSTYNMLTLTGTTLLLYVRDVEFNGEKITFFIQSTGGDFMEWDFSPQKEWVSYNFNWMGDTAKFPIELNLILLEYIRLINSESK
jgi:hypothetical protein